MAVALSAPAPTPALDEPDAPAALVESGSRSRASMLVGYLGRSLLVQLRAWPFLVFIIGMPVTLYLFFAGIYGAQEAAGGVTVAAIMMATMATYGGLGAALNAGNNIQTERSSGWLRQVMITALRPTDYLLVKTVTAVLVVVPAIGAVYLAAAIRGVRLDADVWAASFALELAALSPMIVFGLVIGLWFKQQAAQAATTILMLVLSMLGGLWFPLDMMPEGLQSFGQCLPSYWAGRLGVWPIIGGDFPLQGIGVLATWTVGLCLLALLGYRRAVRTSRR